MKEFFSILAGAALGAGLYSLAKQRPLAEGNILRMGGLLMLGDTVGELASWATKAMKEAEAAALPGPKEWSPRTGRCRCSHARAYSGVTFR
jgi:hypothetical protein